MEIITERNLVFAKTDKEYLTADVYRPSEGEDLPAVILIHGGGFQSGSKEMYGEWGTYLAEAGLVTIAINYRLTTPTYSTWPGILDDVTSAVNWLVSMSNEWKVNPLRIGLVGDSAGANLAMHYALRNATNASFKISAAVGVYGVYDFVQRWKDSKDNNYKTEKLVGATLEEAEEKYKDASPMNFIESAVANPIFDTSFFIIWGERDRVAFPNQSENFVKRLKENGMETKTLIIPDMGHFWFNITTGLEGGKLSDYPNTIVAQQVLDFLIEKLTIEKVGNFSASRVKALQELL